MYITYETAQYVWNQEAYEYIQYSQPVKTFPDMLPKPYFFMPTKLVRISDMTTVDGSQVNEGYCALSYSWSQSGEISRDKITGKHKRIDKGRHKIINEGRHKIISPESNKMKRIRDFFRPNSGSDNVTYVKFEGIIQHICQQFNIKYLWYDQMCINQDDKNEKSREIRKMQYIYSNAYCTVALVPEFKHKNKFIIGLNGEEYFKRLWTLEEAIKSQKLLFVGRNKHKWGGGHDDVGYFADILVKPLSEISVSQILHHAHRRRSTKEHDRVFALISLFPEIMQHIDINYEQKLEDLMIQFYGLLAKKDISILLFDNVGYNSAIQKYSFLPSWTGVNGKHLASGVITACFRNYDVIGKTMYATSEFVTNDKSINNTALIIRKEGLPPSPDDINDDYNKVQYRLHVLVQLPKETKSIRVTDNSYLKIFREEKYFRAISKELQQLSMFMDIKKETLYWHHHTRDEHKVFARIDLRWLTESMGDPSAQYVILSDIRLKSKDHSDFYLPVIKKRQSKEYYKAIGCCRIESNVKYGIFSDCNLPRQTFLIQ